MHFQAKEGLIIFCVFLLTYCVQTVPADNLNCYTTDKLDVSKVVKKDCHMHTGCLKRYNKKTRRTLEKSCYLTRGGNDTCFPDPKDANVEVCWCHTDLCNNANRWPSAGPLSWFFRVLAWMSFLFFLLPVIGNNGQLE